MSEPLASFSLSLIQWVNLCFSLPLSFPILIWIDLMSECPLVSIVILPHPHLDWSNQQTSPYFYQSLIWIDSMSESPASSSLSLIQWVNLLFLPTIVLLYAHLNWSDEWTSCFFLSLSILTLIWIDPISKPLASFSLSLIQWVNLLFLPTTVLLHTHWIDLMSKPSASSHYCPSSPSFGLIQ